MAVGELYIWQWSYGMEVVVCPTDGSAVEWGEVATGSERGIGVGALTVVVVGMLTVAGRLGGVGILVKVGEVASDCKPGLMAGGWVAL